MPVIILRKGKPTSLRVTHCERPRGWIGRLVIWRMNRSHSTLTDWGLRRVSIGERDTILDVGCGGGRTASKLAARASAGTVHGIDYAEASVAAARRFNRRAIAQGRVVIQQASVSELPFPNDMFDLVTAVETHFWWQDLPAGMREVLRVLKPGGRMLIIAEFYNGGKHARYVGRLARWTTMAMLDVDQHKAIFSDAGFTDIHVEEELATGWICAMGMKPAS
ncbi:MAG TPA: class I SAM-dependent methyltransferase [Gemmatimonadaceae bacterium]